MASDKPINLNAFVDSLSSYVVKPINAFGLGGFVFDSEGETNANLTAEITDHFVEDGTTISDHIAIKPKKITLKNYVGELVYRQDDSTDTPVQKAVQKLTTVSAYLPSITEMAQQVLDLRRTGELNLETIGNLNFSKTINRVTDYWAIAKNILGTGSRQQQAYSYFKAMYEQKLLVSVQTPFEFMNSMAIESITAIQEENEKYVSNFSITLKEIRTAKDIYSPRNSVKEMGTGRVEDMMVNVQGRAAPQLSQLTNNGNVPGIEITEDNINEYFAGQYNPKMEKIPFPKPPGQWQ